MCRLPDLTDAYPEAVPKFTLVTLVPSTSKSRVDSSGVMFAKRIRVFELPQLEVRKTAVKRRTTDTLVAFDGMLKVAP